MLQNCTLIFSSHSFLLFLSFLFSSFNILTLKNTIRRRQGQSVLHRSSNSSTSSSSCIAVSAGGHHRHCRYSTSVEDDANEPLLCDETVCSAFVTSAASLIPAITAESPTSWQASSTCSAASELEFGSVTEPGGANASTATSALGSRPPRLQRRLFPSSSSSSQV